MDSSYTIPFDKTINAASKLTNYKELIKNVVSKFVVAEDQHVDELLFMESFDFPNLKTLKSNLTKTTNYSKDQIEEVVNGLNTLSEYSD